MPIQFRCSQCNQSLSIATRKAGSAIRCPVCQGELTVPNTSETIPPRKTETAIVSRPAPSKDQTWWTGEEPRTPAVISNGQPDLTEKKSTWWVAETPAPQPPTGEALWEQITASPPAPPITPPEPTQPAPSASDGNQDFPSEKTENASLSLGAGSETIPNGFRFSRRQAILAGSGAAAAILVAVVAACLALPNNSSDNAEPETSVATVPVPAVDNPAPPAIEAETVALPEQVAAPTPDEVKLMPQALLPEPPKVEPAPAKEPAPRKPLVVKRRDRRSEEDLRKQLEKVPELTLDAGNRQTIAFTMVAHARTAHQQRRNVDVTPLYIKQQRPDLAGLPMRMGEACKIGPSTAEHLEGGSLKLRSYLFDAVQASASKSGAAGRAGIGVPIVGGTVDPRPDPTTFNDKLSGDGDKHSQWLKPEAIPALMQLLMAENQSIRRILIEQLARIEGYQATVALAQRALFDLNPEIRAMAINALRDRSSRDYLPTLLAGFRYPWAPVADHAAEALVALESREAIPKVLSMLDQPAPNLAYGKEGKPGTYVHEVVRINHMRNCVMCHAPSLASSDKVRGFVPDPTKPVPPSFTRAYYGPQQQGIFVRADVTYLQQDFSVPQPVANHGAWPSSQRYDYMIRERVARPAEVAVAREAATKGPSEQQKSMFFALRELTSADPGPTSEDWKRLFLQRERTQKLHGNLGPADGMAVDMLGNVYYSDSDVGKNAIYKVDGDGKVTRFLETAVHCTSIMFDPAGRLIACQPSKGRIVAIDLASKAVTVLADKYQGKRFDSPDGLVVDRHGGVYFTDLNIASLKAPVYYLSSQGTLTRVLDKVPWARGIRLAPDEKTLYLLTYATPEVWAYPLEGAGLIGQGKVLCKLQQKPTLPAKGGTSMAVDMDGNLYLTNPMQNAIQVVTPEGTTLAQLPLPETPAYCCFGGTDLKTLYVRTQRGLYGIKVETAGHKFTKQR